MLALVALIPAVGAGAYTLNGDPPEPSVQAVLADRLVEADDTTSYYFVVTKGPYKGDVNDAAQILTLYPTAKSLREHGAPPHKWVQARCVTYGTTGSRYSSLERESVQHCTTKEVTLAQVRKALGPLARGHALGVPAA